MSAPLTTPLPVLTQHPANDALAATQRKTLAGFLSKWDRWSTAISEFQAGEREYPSLRLMPSKDYKHRAYGAAHYLVRAYGIQAGGAAFYPMNPADLRRILDLTDPKRWS